MPEEYKKKLETAGLKLETCELHLACTLSILHFLYKRKFKIKKTEASKTDVEGVNEEEGETFENAVQQEVLDGPDIPEASSHVNSVPQVVSNEMTLDDLAREARSITEGDPLTMFTKFVSHGQGCVFDKTFAWF